MSQQPIRMTEGFHKAKVLAGQLTESDANGEWQRPQGSSPESDEQFLEILRRISRPTSLDQA